MASAIALHVLCDQTWLTLCAHCGVCGMERLYRARRGNRKKVLDRKCRMYNDRAEALATLGYDANAVNEPDRTDGIQIKLRRSSNDGHTQRGRNMWPATIVSERLLYIQNPGIPQRLHLPIVETDGLPNSLMAHRYVPSAAIQDSVAPDSGA